MTKLKIEQAIKENKALTSFSFLFIVVFVFLGAWQIERAGYKTALVQSYEQEQAKIPQPLSNESSQWSRAFIDGSYDPKTQILIDNQIYNGKVGYKIFTPFYYSNGKGIFIDRGWIPQGASRNQLPNIDFVTESLRVVGTLVRPEKELLAGDEILTNSWPMVSQTKSPKIISSAFDAKFLDMILILDPGSKLMNEYVPVTPFVITPTKHYGYALQWFTMSIVLAGMFLYAIKREK